jgi:hypothetical protein
VVFFLVGLWLATAQRRYGTEKTTLVRSGAITTVAARQLTVVAAAVVIVTVTLFVDVVSRTIAQAWLAAQMKLDAFPPLEPPAQQHFALQLAVILLVAVLFGIGGVAVGSVAGVFAIPALVFLAWDFILPIAAQNDPRNWFTVLGHSVFTYSNSFQLIQPIPVPILDAALLAIGTSIALAVVGYVGIRIRNPLAS